MQPADRVPVLRRLFRPLWICLVALPGGWIASLLEGRENERANHRVRAPQEPYRQCLPPGIPDAVPFSYTEGDSDEA